ncbi:hypothetical protein BC567DRAFT_263833 [Phyllosticta citribraziliensis]
MASSSKANDPLISVHAASGNEYCQGSRRVLIARDETTRKEAWYGRLGRSGDFGYRSRVFNLVEGGKERPEILDELPLTPYFGSRVEKTGKDWRMNKLYPVVHGIYKAIFGEDQKPSDDPKPTQPGTPNETTFAENSKGRKRLRRPTVEGADGRKKLRMSKSKAQVVPQSTMNPYDGDIMKEQDDQGMAFYDRPGSFSSMDVDMHSRVADILKEQHDQLMAFYGRTGSFGPVDFDMHSSIDDLLKEQHDQRMAFYNRTGSFGPIDVDIRKADEKLNER